ncbi:MAG: hypothetical protein H6558_22005 [Lewinellaceae bacterium]|nr:hypothetical protein [Lewinellaceae bacterium]
MKYFYCLTITVLFVFSFHLSFSQPIPREDIRYKIVGGDMEITYDLEGASGVKYYDVLLKVFIDGVSFEPEALEGTNLYVKAGRGRVINWKMNDEIEMSGLGESNMKVELTAVPFEQSPLETSPEVLRRKITGQHKKERIPIVIGLTGAGAFGAGLLAAGAVQRRSANVKDYEDQCDPGSSNFDESLVEIQSDGASPCDAIFEKAKSDTSTGNTLMIAGTGVALIGGGILLKALLNNRKKEKEALLPLEASPSFGFYNLNGSPQAAVGMKMVLNF